MLHSLLVAELVVWERVRDPLTRLLQFSQVTGGAPPSRRRAAVPPVIPPRDGAKVLRSRGAPSYPVASIRSSELLGASADGQRALPAC